MIRATWLAGARAGVGLAVLAAFWCGPVYAQQEEPTMLKRAAELRVAPDGSGAGLETLPAQAPVTRLAQRQGGWVQVRTLAGVSGWVHMFDLTAPRRGALSVLASAGGAVAQGLRSITSVLQGGSQAPPRISTATIGVRGLEAVDLSQAQPNLAAANQLERLRLGESGAREFAAEAGLSATDAPTLPAPSDQRAQQPDANSDPSRQ